jgi:hypothetical protein
MNSNVEELLAEELHRQADSVQWPSDVLDGALRRHRRRRIRRQVGMPVLAAGVAAAVAVSVAMIAPHPSASPARGQSVETAAYILGRAKSAIAAASADVLEVRSQSGDEWSITSWVAPNNDIVRLDTRLVRGGHTTFYAESSKTVIVDYQTMSWWSVKLRLARGLSVTQRERVQYRHDLRLIPALLAFQMNASDNGGPKLTLPTTAVIRSELADGEFRLVGTETSGGQRLLELRGTYSHAAVTEHYQALTMWVNAATYLPVRSVAAGFGTQRLVSEFTWLAPTAANLALLKPTIPAGFTYRAPHCPCG